MFVRKKRDSDNNVRLAAAFGKIREEFSEHLQAINENTNEIQSNYEYLCELDAKMDKLAERLDEIAMFIKHPSAEPEMQYEITPLTKNEQEVFQALYTVVHEKGQASYHDIGRRCGLPDGLVQSYITNLIEKGVPVTKKYVGNEAFLGIEPKFCELQAKENLLQINEMISEKVISQ